MPTKQEMPKKLFGTDTSKWVTPWYKMMYIRCFGKKIVTVDPAHWDDVWVELTAYIYKWKLYIDKYRELPSHSILPTK